MKRELYKIGGLIEKNSSHILTGLGMLGVITTAVSAVKATPKALYLLENEKEYRVEEQMEPMSTIEKAVLLTPTYFPTILMGVATMGCIYGANYINHKNQAILTGAYSYLDSYHKKYREKVKELYGDGADEEVKEAIAREQYLQAQLDELKPNMILCYDEFSGRYFEFDKNELVTISYEVNKMYSFLGEMSLNDFYEFMGLETTDFGETVGWCALKDWECTGSAWLDIRLELMDMPDDMDCYAIRFNTDPSRDYVLY